MLPDHQLLDIKSALSQYREETTHWIVQILHIAVPWAKFCTSIQESFKREYLEIPSTKHIVIELLAEPLRDISNTIL